MSSFYIAPMTPVVKRILIFTVACWLVLQIILDRFFGIDIWRMFVLSPAQVIEKFAVWQLLTYVFFHALSPSHIVFNMLMLWFFGAELEQRWGARFFTAYYFLCGIGAAVIYCMGVGIYSAMTGVRTPLIIPVMGASGALFGLLLAYGIIFSERVIYFMGLFPLKAKHFVLLAFGIDLALLVGSGVAGSEVAYLAHLGGFVTGFIVLRAHAHFKSLKTKSKLKKKSSNLRLVVDNEKKDDNSNPKYWN